MNLEYVLDLMNNVCFNGPFSIEISPIKDLVRLNPSTIRFTQDFDDGGEWRIEDEDEDGNAILVSIEGYQWPKWTLTEELHITIE